MNFITLIILFFLTTTSHAGIVGFGDMSMQSTYTIPYFNSDQEAIRFSNRAKWIEPLLQQMIQHRNELRDNADDPYVGWLGKGQTPVNNIYYEQWHRVDLAVKIMSNWKRQKIHGDRSMGSCFVASSIPTRRLNVNRINP